MKLIDKYSEKWEKRKIKYPTPSDCLRYNFEEVRDEFSKPRPSKKEIEYRCYYIKYHAQEVSKHQLKKFDKDFKWLARALKKLETK